MRERDPVEEHPLQEELAGNVQEEKLTLAQVLEADEVFLTGTTTEVTGVKEIDRQEVGTGEPGPVTRRLSDAYRALWQKECT